MDVSLRDIRYAVRSLGRSAGFTAIAALTLALGIGANTVVFSVLHALILRPLPIDRPESVFFVQAGTYTHSFPAYRDFHDRNRTFAQLAAYRIAPMALDAGAGVTQAWGYLATGSYFELLGLRPAVGRFFGSEDDVNPGASPYAVLSHAYWQRQFGGDPQVVGQSVRINGLPYTVVGVAPRDFYGTEVFFRPELWVPMVMQAQIEGRSWLDSRFTSNSLVIGRLNDGITPAQAEADLSRVAATMASEHPDVSEGVHVTLTTPGLLGNTLRAPVSAFVGGVMALAGLVLLAACANLASLLAVRVIDRFRELAIRMSIGATRVQIVRQVATETLLLCLVGGAGGLVVAAVVLQALSRWQAPLALPIQVDVTPDARVFGFALLVSLMAALLTVIAPARRISQCAPSDLTRQAAVSVGGRRWSVRDALLGAQLALCCILVTACFVSIRGLTEALALPLGFDPRGVHIAGFDLGLAGYTPAEGRALQARALEAVRALPGVVEAAYAHSLPLTTDQSNTAVFPESARDVRPADATSAVFYHVSPDYFRVMRTRLIAGREFTAFDTPDAPRVAIVNETFARKVVGTREAVGKHFRLGTGPDGLREIVGVVEDGKYVALSEEPRPTVFWPATARYVATTMIVVRSTLSDAALTTVLRRVIRGLDPRLPLLAEGTLTDAIAFAFLPAQTAAIALGAFGLLALSLALAGVYGLGAYSVSARVREIGIRVAIGARSYQVLRSILGRTAVVLAAGACVGGAAGIAVSQLLTTVVYHASPRDPVVVVSVALTMMLVGLGAAWMPARRALAVDPARTLRES